ncbi:hypothetical protein DFH07DRAFT_819280 [Mycena maculata]|uniref:Zn(2)-C6 fungal-type domain-containing protein n=1 Tax=Mycena maculata TaxID=230809 RepID=A0AAD7NEX5_9AGAR|nr:hypothetical protein DFH07DRAFT_819280 [Mycena maculata]
MKTTKFKTPTCILCRRRKLRCDGGDPCGPCARTRTPVNCIYVPKTIGQLRSELPKGGACISCRQRKRKCDGNLPCHTCTEGSRADECRYREKPPGKTKPPKPAHHEYNFSSFTSDTASTSSASSSRPTTPPQLTTQDLTLPNEYIPELLPSFDDFSPWSESVNLSPCPPGSYDMFGDLFSAPTFLDSLTLPPPDLSPLSPDRDAELSEVRNLFLEHSWQYGLSVPPEKREALSIGDLSGLTIDPILVNTCELLGYLLRYHSHPDGWVSCNGQTPMEADLDIMIRTKLKGTPGVPPDPLLCLQAYTLLSLYSTQKEDLCGAQGFLRKAGDIVLHHAATLGLEDAPVLDWCPKFDASYLSPQSAAEEVRAAFSQLIYLDIAGSSILELPSILDPALLEQFRRLAAVHRSDTEINFLKAKGMLFLRDSQQLVAGWNQWEFGNPTPSAWSQRYWNLIKEINTHVNFLTTVLMDVSCIPELQMAQPPLKTCIIMSQAALAELHGLFASSQPDSRRKHREAVTEIATITRGFSDKDYQYLDPALSMCWSIALKTLYEDTVEWDGHSGVHNNLSVDVTLHQ